MLFKEISMNEPNKKRLLVRTETDFYNDKCFRLELFVDQGTSCGYSADLYRQNADNWEAVECFQTISGVGVEDQAEAARMAWNLFDPKIRDIQGD